MNGMADLLAPYFAASSGEPSQWLLGDQGTNVSGLMSLLGGKGGNGSGGGGGGMGAVPDVAGSNHWEDVARQMAQRKYGWGPNQFKWLDYVIAGGGPSNMVAESRWDPKAHNPAGAYGIPQMYAPAHPDVNVKKFMANPMMQIRWMLNYVNGRYGDPRHAYLAKLNQGTY